jgi:hypothetical protein
MVMLLGEKATTNKKTPSCFWWATAARATTSNSSLARYSIRTEFIVRVALLLGCIFVMVHTPWCFFPLFSNEMNAKRALRCCQPASQMDGHWLSTSGSTGMILLCEDDDDYDRYSPSILRHPSRHDLSLIQKAWGLVSRNTGCRVSPTPQNNKNERSDETARNKQGVAKLDKAALLAQLRTGTGRFIFSCFVSTRREKQRDEQRTQDEDRAWLMSSLIICLLAGWRQDTASPPKSPSVGGSEREIFPWTSK